MKFAIICVKKRQKAGFLRPRSSKIIVTKEKERRKRKSEEKEKKAVVALLVFTCSGTRLIRTPRGHAIVSVLSGCLY